MQTMLAKEQEVDVEVTFEDQQRINAFGRINAHKNDLVDEITEDGKVLDSTKDAITDLEEFTLECEDAPVYYKYGDCFFEVSGEEAKERVEAAAEAQEAALEEKKKLHEKVISEINDLKQVLYSRFGSSINLEE